MWRALYQAFDSFWNPTPEAQALKNLRGRWACFKLGMKVLFCWRVFWRRCVVGWVAMQLVSVGYLAVRGFEAVALERQKEALENPPSWSWEQIQLYNKLGEAQAKADQARANYYCSMHVDPRSAGLNFRCR